MFADDRERQGDDAVDGPGGERAEGAGDVVTYDADSDGALVPVEDGAIVPAFDEDDDTDPGVFPQATVFRRGVPYRRVPCGNGAYRFEEVGPDGSYLAAARLCQQQHRAVLKRWGIFDVDDLNATFQRAGAELENGTFFMRSLGLVATTDPSLTMTLLVLRCRFIEELGAVTTIERLLVDQALIAMYHQIRLHEILGNVEARIERDFFDKRPLQAKYGQGSDVRQYEVDDHFRRLHERLIPALERCQRMLLRSLRELRAGRQPRVAIGRNEGQVNIADKQVVGMTRGE